MQVIFQLYRINNVYWEALLWQLAKSRLFLDRIIYFWQ